MAKKEKVLKKVFTKEQILTIPNLLTLVRFLLIPLIVCLYCIAKDYYSAALIIIVSGLTDVADGIIARKFNMVSDFGKIMDPVADKCTQGSIVLCLASRYPLMWMMLGFFVLKEIIMATLGYLVMKRGLVNSAKWYGKLNTVVLYCSMMVLVLLPDIEKIVVNLLISVCMVMMFISLVLYVVFYAKILKNPKIETREEKELNEQ